MSDPQPDTSSAATYEMAALSQELRTFRAVTVTKTFLFTTLLGFAGVIVGIVAFVVQLLLSNHVSVTAQAVVDRMATSTPLQESIGAAVAAAATARDSDLAARIDGLADDLAATREQVSTLATDTLRPSDLDPIASRLESIAATVDRIAARDEDARLAPTTPEAPTPFPAPAPMPSVRGDIVATAIGAGSFQTLIAAVEAAGLAGTLKGDGPFTVFAPTDDAFAALPDGTVEGLLRPENIEQLRAILSGHVVPGALSEADLDAGKSISTLNGTDVTVADQGGLTVDGARVVQADIAASNGVIHVIDHVILPN